MYNTIDSIISAYMVQEKRMEFLANNLANVSTSGFKGDSPIFKPTVAEGVAGQANPTNLAAGNPEAILPVSYLNRLQNTSTVFSGAKTDYSQGELVRTGNKLDLALRGKGFFAVTTPKGTMYTRNGHFTINEEGTMVTSDGFTVLGSRGPIKIEKENVVVKEDGGIVVDGNPVDDLMIVDLPSPDAVKKVGGNLFAPTGAPLPRKNAEGAEVIQGFLEGSNVNVVRDMTMLIEISRAYESYQKVVQSLNEVLSRSVNEISRLA